MSAGKCDFEVQLGLRYQVWTNNENQISHLGCVGRYNKLPISAIPMTPSFREVLEAEVNKLAAEKAEKEKAT
jgi:hypothetical protein